MTTPPSDLRKVHMLLTYILSEFDRVCGQIGVDYALYGGSAIGAVRHGGFIPWDDDIDVFMLRPDYERFLHICLKVSASTTRGAFPDTTFCSPSWA